MPHGTPGRPCDPEDNERDPQADEWIGELVTDRYGDRARDHAERDDPVYAGVVAVCDERRTLETPARPQPHLGASSFPRKPTIPAAASAHR